MPGVSVCTKSFIVAMELLNYFPTFREQNTNSGKFNDLPKVTWKMVGFLKNIFYLTSFKLKSCENGMKKSIFFTQRPYSNFANCPSNVLYGKESNPRTYVALHCSSLVSLFWNRSSVISWPWHFWRLSTCHSVGCPSICVFLMFSHG